MHEYVPQVSDLVRFTGTPLGQGWYSQEGQIVYCNGVITGLTPSGIIGNLSLKLDMPMNCDNGARAYGGDVKALFSLSFGVTTGIITPISVVPADRKMICTFTSILTLGVPVDIKYNFSYSWQASQ